MAKYIKKPIVVEAIHLTKYTIDDAINMLKNSNQDYNILVGQNQTKGLIIEKDEGKLVAFIGDYIIKDEDGCYPCREDIFKETYQEIPEDIVRFSIRGGN